MRLSFITLAATASLVSAAPAGGNAPPALPLDKFNTQKFTPLLSLEEAFKIKGNSSGVPPAAPPPSNNRFTLLATCGSPRVRKEWNNLNDGEKAQFTDAIKCLMGKPKKSFAAATSRYEDFVALHQSLTPNVHGNAKFLLWHRYYLWTFEQELRNVCGFTGPLPWFDESKVAGRFAQSSVFSSTWFGSVAVNGGCVTNGKFANLACNIGPGSGNSRHCLARNNDDSATANTNTAMVDACNSRTDYADMAACAEGGAHAWGHNGIGAVMSDVYASPSDPVFWLHHAFIDRNFRIWQNKDSARTGYVDGTDRVGNRLTLDTSVSVNGFQPNTVIRDILDTMGTKLCYKYDY